ncbi:hypothetical protein V6G44_001990 [Burkholderia multivorans]|nr:hypothetical protein [Burkholderia multivorans]MDN7403209.1 hypothetical protein [Burkholderia multivorans]MDN7418707.1 hypothetical protein [Burkholderia multivorans]MDN7651467.1 hypothetical protein [Burkholderia multivorans]MDN7688510.1 hypothetical protein [Burkholderia multivorans]
MKLDLPRGTVQRFALGRLLATPNALAALMLADASPLDLLKRHAAGDWGDVPLHDRRENELAVKVGSRLMSSYTLLTKARVWVITEADRSATTLLLPDEY